MDSKNKQDTHTINSEKIIEEIKKDYLESTNLLGSRVSTATLYKKYYKKYKINRHLFLAILNEAHRETGSQKRYDIYRKRHKNENKLIYSDLPPSYYE